MDSRKASRIDVLLKRQSRKENRRYIAEILSENQVPISFLSNETQDKLLSKLRGYGNTLHDNFYENKFKDISKALEVINYADRILISEMCVFVQYRADEGAAFLAPAKAVYRALLGDPFLISQDGFIILDPEGLSGAIFDYEGSQRSSAVIVTFLGYAAENVRSGGCLN